MTRKIVSCKIFEGFFEDLLNKDDEVVFYEIDEHLEPWKLQEKLQNEIDSSEKKEVVLLFGICGNATCGLKSKNHIVKVLKIHDCTAAVLGSNERFLELFKDNLSQTWSSANYYQHSKSGKSVVLSIKSGFLPTKEAYIEKYGEDNGEYLWALLRPNSDIFYLTFNQEIDQWTMEAIKNEKKHKIVKIIEATKNMIRNALTEDENVFTINENELLLPNYDFAEVFKKEKQ